MIRVLHLITGLNVGGAEVLLLNLTLRGDRREFEHRVVSMLEIGPIGSRLLAEGIEVLGLGMRPGVPSLSAVPKLVRILSQSRPDLLYCWMYHANLLGLVAGKIAGVKPIVWSIHSSDPELWSARHLTGWVIRIGGWLSRVPEFIVFNSQSAKMLHEARQFESSRSGIIFSGFDLDRFKPDLAERRSVRVELGLDDETILIGMIARWHPMKDHANFLHAAGMLARAAPAARFLLAGRGVTADNPELWRLVRKNALEGRVHLLGFRDDVHRLNTALDIFCLSSSGESFANVVAEAMACEVPCVVAESGAARDVVGGTGRVVPARNSEALAACLAELAQMGTEERRVLGQRARQRIKEHFPLSRFVGNFESLCRRLVASKNSPEQASRVPEEAETNGNAHLGS